MIDDVGFLAADTTGLGVGQYNASWERIEAEWYTSAADGVTKQETGESSNAGFAVRLDAGGWVFFQLIHEVPTSVDAGSEPGCTLTLGLAQPEPHPGAAARAIGAGKIEVHEGALDGRIVATCDAAAASAGVVICTRPLPFRPLLCAMGEKSTLCT